MKKKRILKKKIMQIIQKKMKKIIKIENYMRGKIMLIIQKSLK
jgi:hypothetical protein